MALLTPFLRFLFSPSRLSLTEPLFIYSYIFTLSQQGTVSLQFYSTYSIYLTISPCSISQLNSPFSTLFRLCFSYLSGEKKKHKKEQISACKNVFIMIRNIRKLEIPFKRDIGKLFFLIFSPVYRAFFSFHISQGHAYIYILHGKIFQWSVCLVFFKRSFLGIFQ